MERLRKIAAGNYWLTVATADLDGLPVTVTSPYVAINDGAGAIAFAQASAIAAAGSLSKGVDAAALGGLDRYECSWSGTVAAAPASWTSHVEIVGGFLFELAELRASDPALADATKYPAATVRAARIAAESRFEAAARVAFVPRGRRLTLFGTGSSRLRVPDTALRRVVSASIAGVALTAGELAELKLREWGAIDRPTGKVWTDAAAITLWYEHGEDYAPPPVSQAAMLLAREYLVRKAIGSRATVEATDVGTFRLSVAGKDGSTGLPEVDAVAAAFGRRRPVVA